MNFHIARALELFINDVVHPASGLYQRRGDNRKAAAVFNVARSAKEPLGLMQRARVHTAGKRFSRCRDGEVVRPRKARDGVHQHHNILALLNKAHGAFLCHLGYAGVMLGQLVKRGIKHLALDRTLHIRHFLRPLVDQQHDQVHVRVIVGNAVRNIL